MSLQSVPLLSVDFLPSRPVEIEVSPAPLTSDAGLIPIRQFDEQIRLTEQFAAVLDDPRDPTLTRQSLLSMVRQRIYGILADYEDQNDHDTLRSDPVFKLIADRLPDDPDLASQPTLSRFENAASIPDLWRLRDVLVDLFIQSFDTPPHHLTLDIDAFDDPAHGQQQLIMFHGYSALCENRKVSDSYYPWFFRGLGVSPGHNTPQRVSSADRELRRPLKSQGKIAHLTTVSFRKVQVSQKGAENRTEGPRPDRAADARRDDHYGDAPALLLLWPHRRAGPRADHGPPGQADPP